MIQTTLDFLGYFFDFTPPTRFPLQNIVWAILALNLLIAIVLFIRIRTSKDKQLIKLLQPSPKRLITIEVLLAVNLLSRLYRVEVLSMRLFTYLLIIWMVYSYVQITLAVFKKYPESLKQSEQKDPGQGRFHLHRNKKRHS
jgi:hypothetical protein